MSEHQEALERYEYAILDVVRLALSGDSRSLLQRSRNLTRGGADPVLSAPARKELQRLLAQIDSVEHQRAVSLPHDPRRAQPGEPVELHEADAPALDQRTAARVEQLIREHERRHLLEEANLTPSTRILLTGPPGNGKTMTARWIACRLHLPIFEIEPGHILTSLMGESAHNLTSLLAEATARPGVVLLDELDAYARDRGQGNDIAEPKRLVNTLLLELDRWPERSLLIAATNHAEALDNAVRRRFESTFVLDQPDRTARRRIIHDVLARAHRQAPEEILEAISLACADQNASALVNSTVAALRRSILDEIDPVTALTQQFFASRFTGRRKDAADARTKFIRVLAAHGYSVERLGELTLASPSTVRTLLAEEPAS
jgi:MoxR-like ATPase